MSYSFNVLGDTKEEAKASIAKMFREQVVVPQPVHAADMAAALANADAAIDLLEEMRADQRISVTCNGWVSFNGEASAPSLQSVSITTTATLITKES